MAEDRAKWDAAYQIYCDLRDNRRVVFDRVDGLLKVDGLSGSLNERGGQLAKAIEQVLLEIDIEAAKASREDMIKDYEDALAGADIVAALENVK